jgi:membrane fusion protein (multidrug efflux system)
VHPPPAAARECRGGPTGGGGRGRGRHGRAAPWAFPAVALACWAMAACREGEPPAPGPAPAVHLDDDALAVAAVREIAAGPRISGSLEPRRAAAVRARVGGEVLAVEAELGERVTEGQVLATLEARALRNAESAARVGVASARAELSVATQEAARAERLAAAGALAPRDRDLARTGVAAARARLGEARARLAAATEQLDAATVRAPLDGVVSRREIGQGDVIAPGALLYEVIDPSSMRLEASVDSARLPDLAPGTPVEFAVRGYPDQIFTGRIERISPAADPVTRQIPILVDLPNPGGRLVAGLFAEGTVAAVRRETLVIPAGAVDEERLRPTVAAVRGGRVEEVPVEVGIRDERNERVEIRTGLVPGDLVLVGPARATAPGTPVILPPGFREPEPPAEADAGTEAEAAPAPPDGGEAPPVAPADGP